MTDRELLDQYVASASEPAFAELVRRHADWVHSAAVRLVHDPHLAEDVAQAVFITLARKARTIAGGASVTGWLFNVARYCSAHALRAARRRDRHERRAAAMKDEAAAEASSTWEQIAPLLDQLVARLPREDREALLLRFYQRKSMADVGSGLRVSEDAAKKRVARAVERLRGLFARKGVTMPAAALGSALLARTTEAASPALLQTIAVLTTVAPTGGVTASAAGFTIAKGAITAMLMTKVKAVAAVVLVALVPVGLGCALLTSKGEDAQAANPSLPQHVEQAGPQNTVIGLGIPPQAQPVLTLLEAVKDGDQEKLKTAFTERIRMQLDNQGWDETFKTYQEGFKQAFGDYNLKDFTFEFAGGDEEGRVSVLHEGKKRPALAVVKERTEWKLNER